MDNQPGDAGRAGNKTRRRKNGPGAGTKTIPLMFVGLVMILVPVEAGDEFRAVVFDCSTPSNIRQFDAEAHCKNKPLVSGEMAKVKILQHVTNEQLSGYKCEVRAHRKSYYCGMFSYSKPILREGEGAKCSDKCTILFRDG